LGRATLSLSTNCFLPDELLDCLECAAQLGLAGVEVGPRNAVRLFESAAELAEAEAAFARLALRKLSVHAWTQVDGLEEVCPFVQRIGGELIVVHSPPAKLDSDFEGEVRELLRWDSWCRQRGIVLTVENGSRQICAQFAELFRAVPELRATLDVKHAYKPETLGTTHRDFWPHLVERLANFHLSGVNRARDELGDGCPPSDADNVDWRELGRELAGIDYAGVLTAELTFPRHLSDAEIAAGYADLGDPRPDFPTLQHRLARNGVDYLREALAPALRPGA
jgi:sugar phosphate isomerase/epimerase